MGFAAALAMTTLEVRRANEAARRHGSGKVLAWRDAWWWEPPTAEVHLQTCGRKTYKQPETARALWHCVQVADESRVTAVQAHKHTQAPTPTTCCPCDAEDGGGTEARARGPQTCHGAQLSAEGPRGAPSRLWSPKAPPSGSSHLQSCTAAATPQSREIVGAAAKSPLETGVGHISPVEEPTLQHPDNWEPAM